MFDQFKGRFVSESHSLRKRPQLAARVGLIIAMWSAAELQLSNLLSIILGTDAPIGATLFNVVKAESGRLAMLKAVAEEKLPKPLSDEYAALQKRVVTVGRYRDAMAHGSWAISDDDPDSLILIDSREVARYVSAITGNIHKMGELREVTLKDRERASAASKRYQASARRYGPTEFAHIEAEIEKLLGEIAALTSRVIAER